MRPEAAAGFRHGGRERRFAGDVGLPRHAFAGAALPDHCGGFLGGGKPVIDREHACALLREAQADGAAVAHALARRLACADDDGGFVLEAHQAIVAVGWDERSETHHGSSK